jgi:hypothetical protein
VFETPGVNFIATLLNVSAADGTTNLATPVATITANSAGRDRAFAYLAERRKRETGVSSSSSKCPNDVILLRT